jgi:spore maturation protein CgeB
MQFLLGGAGWADKPKTANIRYLDHVGTSDHNAFNSTPRIVLNISRSSMARFGFSPATRVFEAAGAGACVLTDAWTGIEEFFEPGSEILVASSGDEVAAIAQNLSTIDAQTIGTAALRRVRAEHTYRQRAELVEAVLNGASVKLSGVTT